MMNKTKLNYLPFICFLILALILWSLFLFMPNFYVDEYIHYSQISLFLSGNYSIVPKITTFPFYHLVIAKVSSMFGYSSNTFGLRLVSFLISLVSVWIFYLLAIKLNIKNYLFRTLQFVFLPISFIYFALIYTDIFSLFLVLIAFYMVISRRKCMAQLFSLASVLVRQNNIVWTGFFYFYGYILENGFNFSFKRILIYTKKNVGYIIILILFILFTLINNGIVIGDKEMHQPGIYWGNIYFFFAVVGFLFAPLLLKRVFSRVKINKVEVVGMVVGVIIALSFLAFPPLLHRYNLMPYFLRNEVLNYTYCENIWIYTFFIFSGVIAIFNMGFEKKDIIIFPFIFLYLVPSFLIEQRYLIIPLIFILLFRKEESAETEWGIFMYFLLLTFVVLFFIFSSLVLF
ncbi:hypothetical protein MNSC_12080 [Minisyncoccus archaeophilus]